MTSLKIIPNFEKKTAKFEGTIAGGERVRVEISDVNKYIGGLNSLRLRAVGSQGETLAQFPFENSEDTWVQENGKIICELNLNTDKLLEAVPPASRVMVLFVLDDGKNEVLYFKSFCAVDHWPRKVGEEEPVDLGGYADFVKDATESIASAEVAIEKASENAMNASKNAEEAAKNAKEAVATVKKIESSLSTKADKTALDTEISRATHSEAQIDSKINTIIADDAGKSARTIAAEEVAKVVADAPADFDTLKEIAEYIESDKTGAAQMVTKIDANANAISAETQRAQEAEAALRRTVDGKADKVANATAGNLASLDENGNLVDSGNMVAGAFTAGSFIGGGSGLVGFELDSTDKWVELYINLHGGVILKFPLHGDTLAVQEDIAPTFDDPGIFYDEGALVFHDGLYRCVNPNGHTGEWLEADFSRVTVEDVLAALRRTVDGKVDAEAGKGLSSNDYTNEDRGKLAEAYTPANPPPPPDLSGYATKAEVELVNGSVASLYDELFTTNNKVDAALPRYQYTSAGILDGVVTIPPYVYAGMLSGGTAFTVAVGEGNGYMRDCILIVECGDVAPTITWPANFHPRTDAETDFACKAGVNNAHVNNVYWISEYVQGEFVVAGWQATAGGSAV